MFNMPKEMGGFKFLDVSFTFEELELISRTLEIMPGHTILDPFAGAGTASLFFAPIGVKTILIESNPGHYELLTGNLAAARRTVQLVPEPITIFGDSLVVDLPEFRADYIITSPPFTISETSEPFHSIEEYEAYIKVLGRIFERFKPYMNTGGRFFIEMGDDVFRDAGGNNIVVPLKDMLINELVNKDLVLESKAFKYGSGVNAYYLLFRIKTPSE